MSLQAGSQVRLTDTGELLTIWSPAHLPGCYWAHRASNGTRTGSDVILIRVRNAKASARPIVTLVEDQ